MNLLLGIKELLKTFSFSTKMAPVRRITAIELLSFFTNTAPQNVYFIVIYHLLYAKKE